MKYFVTRASMLFLLSQWEGTSAVRYNEVAFVESAQAPYNCSADLWNWKNNWTQEHKAQCCLETGNAGCEGCFSYENSSVCVANTPANHTDTPCHWTGSACVNPPDCTSGVSKWQTGWSQMKKDYCCAQNSTYCEVPTPQPTVEGSAVCATFPDAASCPNATCKWVNNTCDYRFDCQAGLWNWERGWSGEKKDFCCEETGQAGCRACPEFLNASTCPDPRCEWEAEDFDPAEGHCKQPCDCTFEANWNVSWAPDKIECCCEKEGDPYCGPPTPAPTPISCGSYLNESDCPNGPVPDRCYWTGSVCEIKFDCLQGLAMWTSGWSEQKKLFCCMEPGPWGHAGCEGCSTYQTSHECPSNQCVWHDYCRLPFDCTVGTTNWQLGWSHVKKQYCCTESGVGCEGNSSL